MTITNATKKATRYACMNFHYAKAIPIGGISYNIFNQNKEWCGVIIYSYGANPRIGMPYGLKQGEICELTRVALNGKQESTSQAVALSLKQLKKDAPLIRLVVSYADCDQNHIGTIYQATNWIYEGEKVENTIGGFLIHERGVIKKYHKKSIYSHMIVENGVKKHCPQTLEYVRKYIDPKAEYFITKGKRKYLMPLDKRMRKQIQHLSQPYPKTDANWQKIDRQLFKNKQ